MTRNTKKLAAVLVLPLLVALSAAAWALPPSPTPLAVTGAGGRAVLAHRPARIVYSADGAALLAGVGAPRARPAFGQLQWTAWTQTRALGRGSDWEDNCLPDCAVGTYVPFGVRVELWRPRRIGHNDVFTRLTITYVGARPPYRQQRSWTADLAYDAARHAYLWAG